MGFWKNIKDIFWMSDRNHEDAEYEERFYRWAFGSSKRLSRSEMIRNWNAIHGDRMILGVDCYPTDHDIQEKLMDLYDLHLDQCKAALQRDIK